MTILEVARRGWLALAGIVIAIAARILSSTFRVRFLAGGERPRGPVIYAFLHGQQLPLLRFPRPQPTAVLVSLSSDGDLQTRVLSSLGFAILRGSSTTGGVAALRACLAWIEGGGDLALAVDGPRGPAGEPKPGVLHLAEKARVPILPVACHAASAHVLDRAWDRFVVPMPFTIVPIATGEPFRPWEQDWTAERKLAYLGERLEALTSISRTT